MTDTQLLLVFDASMADKFQTFHESNPEVYCAFRRLARDWVARTGRRHLGISALTERVRWEMSITTSDPDYRINNNFRAFYARLLMRREPDLGGLFQLRPSMADAWVDEYLPRQAS